MSIIFGLLEEQGVPAAESDLLPHADATNRYAMGATRVCAVGRVAMGLQPYISHSRSVMDNHPIADPYGNLLVFDGRLDNYVELAAILDRDHAFTSDSEIVLSAFTRWGTDCFSRFVGDWALALWSAKDEALYLARDHAGSRTLYFAHFARQLVWATYLETLLSWGAGSRLSEDYVGCYLACCQIGDLTPYDGIKAIRPAHFLVVRHGQAVQRSHWSSTGSSSIRYKSDGDYEEHFLNLFRKSVERRTGPGAPILAQLSGGMDSTSIVCMSDSIRRAADTGLELLDTISFYDDSENSLDERRYFLVTEAKRGKTGIHIDTAFSHRTFDPPNPEQGMYPVPGADNFALVQERRLQLLMEEKGYRSILSGIGGDEVLGGVPSPWPELAGHLVSGNLRRLVEKGIDWSLVERTPLIHTLINTARYTMRLYMGSPERAKKLPLWLSKTLRERVRETAHKRDVGRRRIGIAPHRLDGEEAWQSVMETLPNLFPQILSRPEYRFPFLDRDLLDYVFAIPPDQLQRPGRRRSLMRRALRAIVPQEILGRPRKAFQLHAPLDALRKAESKLERMFADSVLSRAGFVDRDVLGRGFRSALAGDAESLQALYRAIAFEIWLRSGPVAAAPLLRVAEHSAFPKGLTV